jgi:hypothetical protein
MDRNIPFLVRKLHLEYDLDGSGTPEKLSTLKTWTASRSIQNLLVRPTNLEELVIRISGRGTGTEREDHMIKDTKCLRTLKYFLPNQLLVQKFIARGMITKVIFECPTDLAYGQPVPDPTNFRAAPWEHELTPHTDSQQVTDRGLVFQLGPEEQSACASA